MTYPVTVYRWDDPGAPQLPYRTSPDGNANDIKEILLKCLVQGYGNKQPAGWSVVFDDANGLVLQNNVAAGGSGMMVRFWPGPGRSWTTPLNRGATGSGFMQSAKMFSASDAPFRPSTPMIMTPINARNNLSDSNGQSAWVLIATAIGFYFDQAPWHPTLLTTATSMMHNVGYAVYCGDILSNIPGDQYPFLCVTRFTETSDNNIIGNNFLNTFTWSLENLDDTYLSRASSVTSGVTMFAGDGSNTSAKYGLCRVSAGVSPTSDYNTPGQYDMGALFPALILRISLEQSFPAGQNTVQSNISPNIRGRQPGMFTTLRGDGGSFTKWPYIRTIDGQPYYCLRSANRLSCTWINLVQWS